MNLSNTVRVLATLSSSAALVGALHAGEPAPDRSARLLRDASLMLLTEGNARFAAARLQHPHQDAEHRGTTATQGQEPFATVLACSDAREPVELIFDRGLGDLFVIRVAGNVAGESELASVEYGVGHLNTPLLVVLGHTRCDTVTAVLQGAEQSGHFHRLAERIQPAVAKAKAETTDPEETLTRTIQGNVWQTIEDLIQQSSILRQRINSGQVHVRGAMYDLEHGKVTWLGAHPAQDALVALANQAETDALLAQKSSSAPAAAPAESSATARRAPAAPMVRNDARMKDPGERRTSQPATTGNGH